MISLLTSRRLESLLSKERELEERKSRDAQQEYALAWRAIPDLDPKYELDQINVKLTAAERLCEKGSPVASHISNIRARVARILKAC